MYAIQLAQFRLRSWPGGMAEPVSRSAAATAREVKVVFSRLRRRIYGLALAPRCTVFATVVVSDLACLLGGQWLGLPT
jgi:hypothetical protein